MLLRILSDVVIAGPTRAKIAQECAASSHPGFTAREAAKVKECASADRYPLDEFAVIAKETYGCLGQPFEDVLRRCALKTPAPASLGGTVSILTLMAFYFPRVAVALQQAQAVAILRRSAVVETAGAGLPPAPPA